MTGERGGSPGDRRLAEQLRALDDLDAELAAGDLDPDDYRALRDDYTVRVAEAVRRLDGDDRAADGPPGGRSRRLARPLVVAAIVCFAVAAGWLLARSAGERGVGDILTGEIASNRQRVADCQDLGVAGEIVESLRCFDEVLLDDPDNVDALAYRGWFVVIAAPSAEAAGEDEQAAELVASGLTYLDRAVELDPDFPDARAFRAAVHDRLGDAEAACADVAALLAGDPPPFFVDQTRGIAERNGCG